MSDAIEQAQRCSDYAAAHLPALCWQVTQWERMSVLDPSTRLHELADMHDFLLDHTARLRAARELIKTLAVQQVARTWNTQS